jgi:hypothetical protein
MKTTNTNRPFKEIPAAILRDKIRQAETAEMVLITYVGRLTTDGDPELTHRTAQICAESSQDANSIYTWMYEMGFKHGKENWVKATYGLPKLPVMAEARAQLAGYCKGMAEAFEMLRVECESELGTRANVHAYDKTDRPDVGH